MEGELGEEKDDHNSRKMDLIRRHIHDRVPLIEAAAESGVPIRTARRWLSR